MTVPILAAFVSSAALYAGLAGVSIPVLIHLFSRRRFRRVRWAAMDFLLEAERRNRRRVRIEQLVLLALRCLAMLLIGGAGAGIAPFAIIGSVAGFVVRQALDRIDARRAAADPVPAH